MQYHEYTITLQSEAHFGRRAPAEALGTMLAVTPEAVRRTIRMRFEGASVSRGRRAAWLEATSDIRFVDHYGEDKTVLVFEAPVLGEAAEDFFRQPDMFSELPLPTDTGFDLLGDLLLDVSKANAESNFYDPQLLKQITSFERSLNGAFQRADLWGNRYVESAPAFIDRHVIDQARKLKAETPRPQRVRISGVLDMIRGSTMGFGLKLASGQELRGILQDGGVETLHQHFQKEVVVLGKAIYRPSGGVLRIDADDLQPAGATDRFFSTLPKPSQERFELREVIRGQQHKKGLAAIIGKWPGDETDEEIEQALQEIS